MPIRRTQNPYAGVNAHLNSHLQQPSVGWESFHAPYIAAIHRYLNVTLPEGYYAKSEQSFQLHIQLLPDGTELPTMTIRPDITTYRHRFAQAASQIEQASAPTFSVTLTQTFAEEYSPLHRVAVYQRTASAAQPIAAIELLSPGNKPPRSGHAPYLRKRREALQAGLKLIEIDLLHEQAPHLPLIPDYHAAQADSTPYMIVANNPTPSPDAGRSDFYGFGVDEAFPQVPLLLSGEDQLVLNLGEPYNELLALERDYHYTLDYSQPPAHIERYQLADQQRIRQFMQQLIEAP
jgi:hypothetical protein